MYTVDSTTLSVLEAGRKSDPVALFLHGIPASAELWREVISTISQQGWYCLAPHLPGYGDTQVGEHSHYTLKGTSGLLLQWLEQENMKDVWLIGHDIGGGVAQLMVTANEKRFKKLTLSNSITAASWPVPEAKQMIIAARLGLFYVLTRLKLLSFRRLYKAISASFYRSSFSESDFNRVFYDGKFSNKKMALNFQRMLARLDSRYTKNNMKVLAEVTLPVHLVWGMNDTFQPWEIAGKTLEATFENVRVTTIDNCGHYLQLDACEAYIDAVLNPEVPL